MEPDAFINEWKRNRTATWVDARVVGVKGSHTAKPIEAWLSNMPETKGKGLSLVQDKLIANS